MLISELIRKLETEQKKYGDLPVIVHTYSGTRARFFTCDDVQDVATFDNGADGRKVWISNSIE